MKTRVAVIFGGKSVEHEVSVITGLQVIDNLDKSKYEPVAIYIDKEGRWLTGDVLKDIKNFKSKNLSGAREILPAVKDGDRNLYIHPNTRKMFEKKMLGEIDVVIPAVHGTNGEDGVLQGVLEMMNIPYAGCSLMASATGMDKIVMKALFRDAKIPVVNDTWFYRSKWYNDRENIISEIENKLRYPLFVKPSNLGSSVGISKAKDKEGLIEAIEVAVNYDRKIIVEEAVINPREINCAVIGYDEELKASVCEEPVGWKELLSYEDKYINSNSKNGKGSGKRNIPADLPKNIEEEVRRLAKESFKAIDASGNARIDFLLDEDEKVYVNEINTIPGSFAFYLWEPTGISFKNLLTELIEIAERRYKEKNKNIYSYDIDLFNKIGGAKSGR